MKQLRNDVKLLPVNAADQFREITTKQKAGLLEYILSDWNTPYSYWNFTMNNPVNRDE
jgi:hypothetical protein